MKNFIFFALCAFLIIPPSARGQSQAPYNTKYEAYSQMWSVTDASCYFGTYAASPGTQLDTVTTTVAYFPTSAHGKYKPTVNVDTFTVAPLPAISGALTLSYSLLKTAGTPTVVTVAVQQSPDAVTWTSCISQTTATVNPTSLTVPVTGLFYFSAKPNRYVRFQVTNVTAGSTAASFYGNYYWQSSFTYYSVPAK